MNRNTPHYRRQSIRLKGYDYSTPGAYFVTLHVRPGASRMGTITGDAVALNEIGQIIQDCLHDIPAHFAEVSLSEWCIMPDHLHAVIFIIDLDDHPAGVGVPANPDIQRLGGTQPGSLGAVIQNFKAISTRMVNQRNHTPGSQLWQRNYYEHIIRNEKELGEITLYNQENPRSTHL